MAKVKQAAVDNEPFDVYIICMISDDEPAVDTIRMIREKDESAKIILCAYDWADIEEEAKSAGVTGFAAKPLDINKLVEVLKKYIS